MKEFEYPLLEIFSKGLRRFRTSSRNAQELLECHNLMPMEEGPEIHEVITDLNADGVSWGGLGKISAGTYAGAVTRTITINVKDYTDDSDLESVSVYIDDILKGTTDSNGEIDISNVTVGGHTLKLTKTGYIDSDADDLIYNDYIVVT